jgi:hypothetical protein
MRFIMLYFKIPDSTLNAHLTATRITHHDDTRWPTSQKLTTIANKYAPDFARLFFQQQQQLSLLVINEVIPATMMSRVLLFLALVVLSANVRLAL